VILSEAVCVPLKDLYLGSSGELPGVYIMFYYILGRELLLVLDYEALCSTALVQSTLVSWVLAFTALPAFTILSVQYSPRVHHVRHVQRSPRSPHSACCASCGSSEDQSQLRSRVSPWNSASGTIWCTCDIPVGKVPSPTTFQFPTTFRRHSDGTNSVSIVIVWTLTHAPYKNVLLVPLLRIPPTMFNRLHTRSWRIALASAASFPTTETPVVHKDSSHSSKNRASGTEIDWRHSQSISWVGLCIGQMGPGCTPPTQSMAESIKQNMRMTILWSPFANPTRIVRRGRQKLQSGWRGFWIRHRCNHWTWSFGWRRLIYNIQIPRASSVTFVISVLLGPWDWIHVSCRHDTLLWLCYSIFGSDSVLHVANI